VENGGCAASSALAEGCSLPEPAPLLKLFSSPSRIMHNDAPNPISPLSNSNWAHQSSQWLRLDLNGGPRSKAV
jgi:hypothetical protein